MVRTFLEQFFDIAINKNLIEKQWSCWSCRKEDLSLQGVDGYMTLNTDESIHARTAKLSTS